MKSLNEIVRYLIEQQARQSSATLLAVCPNSEAVLEAAVQVAASSHAPMLFAATLNQVDRDGGYTGWTPRTFVDRLERYARRYQCASWLYPCLDHGGPWLKDRHILEHLSYEETMGQVKQSLTACVEAGYSLLHIDPTVDRSLPTASQLPLDLVVERTIELIAHAEKVRESLGDRLVAYEVGTEEVHGGLVENDRFKAFLSQLKLGLEQKKLSVAWPCFVVAQVGTDLHTTYFDPQAARFLTATLTPLGSLAKGHYTDWVQNPEAYPETGMGGANVGPEFTTEEFQALQDLEKKEALLLPGQGIMPSCFMASLESAVVESGRWQKWLQTEERGLDFNQITPERRSWLVQTGARYVWTRPEVVRSRDRLYENLSMVMSDPHQYVVSRIVAAIDRYIQAFRLNNLQEDLLQG